MDSRIHNFLICLSTQKSFLQICSTDLLPVAIIQNNIIKTKKLKDADQISLAYFFPSLLSLQIT